MIPDLQQYLEGIAEFAGCKKEDYEPEIYDRYELLLSLLQEDLDDWLFKAFWEAKLMDQYHAYGQMVDRKATRKERETFFRQQSLEVQLLIAHTFFARRERWVKGPEIDEDEWDRGPQPI